MPGYAYDIYWDDSFEGSGNYTGDIRLTVHGMDGVSVYGTAGMDSGYQSPLTIFPGEPTILIAIEPYDTIDSAYDGSFAFGIMMPPQ